MSENKETEFVESLGLILQAEGFPRIAGRLLGLFVLRAGPLSFHELSTELQVSRGSISTNTRLLETLGAVERVAMPGERQDFFRLSDMPYERIAAGKVERARAASDRILSGRDAVADDDIEKYNRVTELSDFFSSISNASAAALEEIRTARGDANRPRVVVGE